MARGLISIKSTGLKEFINELNGLADNFPEIAKKSLEARQSIVEQNIKTNWVTLVGGSAGGFVASSIGQSTKISKSDSNTVVGTVGVYKLDNVHASFGKTDKDLNAAQIAYWVEFGTSRLRSGKRKIRGLDYDEEELIRIEPKAFISNALYSSIEEQENAFKAEFNRLADQYR